MIGVLGKGGEEWRREIDHFRLEDSCYGEEKELKLPALRRYECKRPCHREVCQTDGCDCLENVSKLFYKVI